MREFLEHFDHFGPELADDPWGTYEEMRASCPALHSDQHGGFWAFTRYRDVVRIARDDTTFSSAHGVVVPPPKNRVIPIDLDPPEFFAYRRMLNPLFSPPAVERLEPDIRALAGQLVDDFVERGSCDLVWDYASPLPAITTLGICGLPREEWHDFAFPIHHGVFRTPPEHFASEEEAQKVANSQAHLRSRIREVLADRRREPQDDAVTYLANASVEGRQLTDDEIVDTVALIIIGGLDTTSSAIGNALIHLSEHPDDRRELIKHPELVPVAIEEFLRYESPVTALARTVTTETEVAGTTLQPGERVLMFWGSANRDEEEFPNADEVVLHRHPNRHLTFGVGIHRCLGSTLARLEFRVALEEILERVPDFEIDRDGLERGHAFGINYGYSHIPATFTPGEPRGG